MIYIMDYEKFCKIKEILNGWVFWRMKDDNTVEIKFIGPTPAKIRLLVKNEARN